jgi:methyl-accepting chemotaxis protein
VTKRRIRGPRDARARFALTSLGSALLATLATGMLCFVPLFVGMSQQGEPPSAAARIADEILALDRHFWKLALGIVLASTGSAVLLYRKIMGPMVRFRRTFDRVARGTLPPSFRLRANDYFEAEAASLDTMLIGLGDRVRAIRDAQESLSREVALMVERVSSCDDPRNLVAAANRLEALDKELADALSGFRREA